MKFYEKLIKLRKQKGLSQEELADRLDVSRQAVYKWEAGTNMPDILKIEKMTRLFDVSFDYLLNEENDAPDTQAAEPQEERHLTEAEEHKSLARPKPRDVYVSKHKINTGRQAGLEHGYAEGRDKRVKDSEAVFNTRKAETERYFKACGYKNVIQIQPKLCLYYFEDDRNKSFGFWFDGAEQFVCPYENYIDVQTSDEGIGLTYESKRMVGVGVGLDGINSISVAKIPMAKLKKPSFHSISVVYRDKLGASCEYKLDLTSHHIYCLHDGHGSISERSMYHDVVSDYTTRRLNDIVVRLKGVPSQAEQIKSGEVVPPELDISSYKTNGTKAQAKSNTYRRKLEAELVKEREAAKKTRITIVAIIAAVLVAAMIFFTAKGMMDTADLKKKEEQISEWQEDAAVIERMIERIGQVTEEDWPLIRDIEERLTELDPEARQYIDNLDILQEAKRILTGR